MILQALSDYYHRKAADPANGIAPEGWEIRPISCLVVLDGQGRFLRLETTEEGEGRNKKARSFLVPQGEKRTVGIKANLLWDNPEYALGANPRNRTDVQARHQAFRDRLLSLGSELLLSPSLVALQTFLDHEPVSQIVGQEASHGLWAEILESNGVLTFRIEGQPGATICDVIPKTAPQSEGDDHEEGICLITGVKGPIARLHPGIKGGAIRGTNTAGAALVSFNLSAFGSYGRTQNFNAPVSDAGAFSYTTALNLLAGKDSENKLTLGEGNTILFWAEKLDASASFNIESEFSWFFVDPPKDQPDRNVRAVRSLFTAVQTGSLPQNAGDRFFILGLAPNAARISVRFWKQGTVKDFGQRIVQHFKDFEIVRGPQDEEFLPLGKVLRATVLEYKLDNVPPNLGAEMVTAILDGTVYPQTLLQLCIRRIRAEQKVGRTRAAICKGILNRQRRKAAYPTEEKEINVSLDTTNTSVGYVLGRLFAVLERCQEQAQGNLNASIRERYYGAFSSTPVTVLPTLIKLNKHHFAKLNPGQKVILDRLMGGIMGQLDANNLPAQLPLQEQARFAVGYYHQRQDFFTSKDHTASSEADQA